MYNLNESLTKFTSKCEHLSSEPANHTVCMSCAITWAKRLADEEAMLATWKSMDDLTLTGLEVLRQVVNKEISDRTQEKLTLPVKTNFLKNAVIVDKMTKDEWLAEHTKNTEIPATTIEWVRSLDPSLHFLAKKFPPSCAVKSKGASYECPRDGHYGIVVNYSTAGEIKVIPAPYDDEASYAGMCNPENLEVVGYWGGLTPTKLNEVLNG